MEMHLRRSERGGRNARSAGIAFTYRKRDLHVSTKAKKATRPVKAAMSYLDLSHASLAARWPCLERAAKLCPRAKTFRGIWRLK